MLTKFPWPARKHTGRPEEAVQSDFGMDRLSHLSTIDWCGAQWLGEARWFYTKGMHAAFWGAASLWSAVFLDPGLVITFALGTVASACFLVAINSGCKLHEAFENERECTEAAIRLWQFEEVARRQAEYDLRWSRPQFDAGEAEGGTEFSPSAEVMFTGPHVNGQEPQF